MVCELLQSVYFGVGNASAMLIGETLGQGNKETAFQSGKRAVKIVWILNVIMTAFMILVSRPVAAIYNFSGETEELLIIALITMAVTITPKMLGYIYDVGILRAGGDTVFCMKLEVVTNLCLQVPMAFFAVLVLKASLPAAMLLVEAVAVIRIAFSVVRFRSRKWINIVADISESEND